MKILIIGYGVVGKNMHKIFKKADIYDQYIEKYNKKKDIVYDVAFVCVPTDMLADGSCDTSIVENVVLEHNATVFCIKSTVTPGTTSKLKKSGVDCVFSPEYFGGTQHANVCEYEFVILGGTHTDNALIAEAYKEVMNGNFKIIQTGSMAAELCKYMENSFLAMKVSFCNEFARIAEVFNVDYNELRELFLMDPRVNRSHTFVYKNKPFYDSHCLNKDVPAIIKSSQKAGYFPSLLNSMHAINSIYKK